jgi:protein TonB
MRGRLRFLLVAGGLLSTVSPGHGQTVLPACSDPGIGKPRPANSHAATSEDYPLLSVVLNEEGTSLVSFDVLTDGTTRNQKLERSSGSPRLDDAAITTTKRWLYTPALSAGKPVACRVLAAVEWKLHGDYGWWGPPLMIALTREDYPPAVLARGEQGVVVLTVFAATDKKARKVMVMQSSGYPDLDEASVDLALGKSHLTLGTYDGKPAGTAMLLVMNWSLRDETPK